MTSHGSDPIIVALAFDPVSTALFIVFALACAAVFAFFTNALSGRGTRHDA